MALSPEVIWPTANSCQALSVHVGLPAQELGAKLNVFNLLAKKFSLVAENHRRDPRVSPAIGGDYFRVCIQNNDFFGRP